MARINFALILLIGVSFIVGCGKSSSQPKTGSTPPKDPEEAALKTVAFVYENYARHKQKPPQAWNDLEGFTSMMDSSARSSALDAIKKIKSLNYKMIWGVDFKRMREDGVEASDYVIAESPDGRLKATYSAKIIKKEKEEVDQKKHTPEAESTESGAPK
ncbi:hypothetical protein [uncultured Gimesia sp.]|uniref:hypothetical protein n=1 Tax=uncultured Gimesia sp. TaxID=1678688 RepID=UPI002632FB22|nr:hypothetical protein [uncultured Gimesia sp.]